MQYAYVLTDLKIDPFFNLVPEIFRRFWYVIPSAPG